MLPLGFAWCWSVVVVCCAVRLVSELLSLDAVVIGVVDDVCGCVAPSRCLSQGSER